MLQTTQNSSRFIRGKLEFSVWFYCQYDGFFAPTHVTTDAYLLLKLSSQNPMSTYCCHNQSATVNAAFPLLVPALYNGLLNCVIEFQVRGCLLSFPHEQRCRRTRIQIRWSVILSMSLLVILSAVKMQQRQSIAEKKNEIAKINIKSRSKLEN